MVACSLKMCLACCVLARKTCRNLIGQLVDDLLIAAVAATADAPNRAVKRGSSSSFESRAERFGDSK